MNVAAISAAATNPSLSGYMAMTAMAQPAPSAPQAIPATSFVDERILQAKLDLAEAKTDTKFAQLMGELKAMNTTLSAITSSVADLKSEIGAVQQKMSSNKAVIISTVIAAAIGIVGLTYAAVSIFASGMGVTSSAYQSGMAASVSAPAALPPGAKK